MIQRPPVETAAVDPHDDSRVTRVGPGDDDVEVETVLALGGVGVPGLGPGEPRPHGVRGLTEKIFH